MGQYYQAINLTSKHRFDNPGMGKLMEFSWIGNHYVNDVEKLLLPGEWWHKERVVFAGDYTDELMFKELIDEEKDERGYLYNIHSWADKSFLDVDSLPKPPHKSINEGEPMEIRYLINYTKKEYVDKNNLPKDDPEWIVHPLPLLLATSNGQGGGDYWKDDPEKFVGSWCGDIIGTSNSFDDVPMNAKEIKPGFKE